MSRCLMAHRIATHQLVERTHVDHGLQLFSHLTPCDSNVEPHLQVLAAINAIGKERSNEGPKREVAEREADSIRAPDQSGGIRQAPESRPSIASPSQGKRPAGAQVAHSQGSLQHQQHDQQNHLQQQRQHHQPEQGTKIPQGEVLPQGHPQHPHPWQWQQLPPSSQPPHDTDIAAASAPSQPTAQDATLQRMIYHPLEDVTAALSGGAPGESEPSVPDIILAMQRSPQPSPFPAQQPPSLPSLPQSPMGLSDPHRQIIRGNPPEGVAAAGVGLAAGRYPNHVLGGQQQPPIYYESEEASEALPLISTAMRIITPPPPYPHSPHPTTAYVYRQGPPFTQPPYSPPPTMYVYPHGGAAYPPMAGFTATPGRWGVVVPPGLMYTPVQGPRLG